METQALNTPAPTILQDDELHQKRQKTFSKLTWGPMTGAIAMLLGAFGGPLLGAGMLGAMGVGGVPFALAATIAAIGAVLVTTGVAVGYYGSRTQNDGILDQTELGAMSNAHYLVKELKANNMCLAQEHPQNCRKDGRDWSTALQQETQHTPETQVLH